MYNGSFFGTLTDVPVTGGSDFDQLSQMSYLPLPYLTQVAPDDADSRYVISSYKWSTYYVVVSSGCGYYAGRSYAYCQSGSLGVQNGTTPTYMAKSSYGCSQVLIKCTFFNVRE